MLSYLPLAHVFDRVMEEAFLGMGGAIGYWRGSLPDLIGDVQALKPTQFHGVPRVFERIYARIQDSISAAGFVKRSLFTWAYNGKLGRLQAGFPSGTAAPRWDKLVFNKVCAPRVCCQLHDAHTRAHTEYPETPTELASMHVPAAFCPPQPRALGAASAAAAAFLLGRGHSTAHSERGRWRRLHEQRTGAAGERPASIGLVPLCKAEARVSMCTPALLDTCVHAARASEPLWRPRAQASWHWRA